MILKQEMTPERLRLFQMLQAKIAEKRNRDQYTLPETTVFPWGGPFADEGAMQVSSADNEQFLLPPLRLTRGR